MWKNGVSMLLSLSLLCAPYMGFALCLTDAETEQIAREIASMKRELSALQMNFQVLKGTLKMQEGELITGSLAALEQSRSGINESLSRIGKVGGGFATIEECISASESSVERLTARVQCIERIIQEAAERESRMDDGNSDAGSCDNRLYDCRDSKE